MIARAVVMSACVLATAGYLTRAARVEPDIPRASLATLPLQVGHWTMAMEPRLDEKVLSALRVDDYAMRVYRSPRRSTVSLYIGFHKSQRQGTAIHSPLNCLPGAGWQPVQRSYATLNVQDSGRARRTIEVNRVVIEKGLESQLVLYWYQGHGRIVASEYWAKAYTVIDAVKHNRTDAALVRVMAPIVPGRTSVEQVESDASDFVRSLFPLLGRHLPS